MRSTKRRSGVREYGYYGNLSKRHDDATLPTSGFRYPAPKPP